VQNSINDEDVELMNNKIKKPATVKELGAVDIGPVEEMLNRINENVWRAENSGKENNFSCFHHTQHIVFKFISGNRENHRDFHDNPAWLLWQQVLLPIMSDAIKPYEYIDPVYPKAMLARLAAGYSIDAHVDQALSNLYTHKIHVPIRTNSQAQFFVNDVSNRLEQGIAYEVNNSAPHWVSNHGDTDRIHFIFEVFDNAIQ